MIRVARSFEHSDSRCSARTVLFSRSLRHRTYTYAHTRSSWYLSTVQLVPRVVRRPTKEKKKKEETLIRYSLNKNQNSKRGTKYLASRLESLPVASILCLSFERDSTDRAVRAPIESFDVGRNDAGPTRNRYREP